VALKSLGSAGEASGPIFNQADPVIRKARDLAQTGVNPTENLAKLFVSLRKTGGWDGLTELIYNTTGSLNGYDQYGHFGRTRVTLSNCLEYVVSGAGTSGCDANFNGVNAAEPAETNPEELIKLLAALEARQSGGTNAGAASANGPTTGIGQADSTEKAGPVEGGGEPGEVETEAEPSVAESSKATSGTEPLLNYLLGP